MNGDNLHNGTQTNGNGLYSNGINGNGVHSSNHVNGDELPMSPCSLFSPIAICGMACRLPGGIGCPQDLWEFLLEGRDARGHVPKSRFNVSAYYSSDKKPAATNTEYGYFLDESVDLGALDTSFFSMHRGEVARLDPQQRLLLEVARESIDDAGEVRWKGKNIGVYVGTFSQDWYDSFNRESLKYGLYQATATHDFMMSERLSHEMDLRGPSMTIRTACSSSLTALNEACLAINRGDCESALVGGTSIIAAPGLMTAMSEQGVLSPDGSCKTFSAAANGYARGESIVSVYVKSLNAALRDGNAIRSVIKGTAINFDGKTHPVSMPNPVAQETLIRRAYQVAGVSDFSKTGYFECHGTGTSAGDLMETRALASVFSKDGIHIGSLKPNLGHAEAASGLSSLIKAVLALEHRTIPPSIKSQPPNPNIPFEEHKLKVPQTPLPWPTDREERVSLNSFGVGGANAHVILESAAMHTTRDLSSVTVPERKRSNVPHLHLYSANTAHSLKTMIQVQKEFLGKTSASFGDIAYTLANRREHLAHRSFAVVAEDTFDPDTALDQKVTAGQPGQPAPSVVMVFTGQGAAWPQFGRDLLVSQPTFSRTINSLDVHLKTLGALAPEWTLSEELAKPARTSQVYKAEFSQPLCTAVQIALVDTLVSLGIKPAAIVGHSSGEIAAAYAAGGLTAEEAITAAFLRGFITKSETQSGGMAAVGLGRQAAEEHLVPGVVIACDNAPNSVTISGDSDKLADVVASVKKSNPNVPATTLKVEKAYHSHHMLAFGSAYQQSMVDTKVTGKSPTIPFFSSVTGKRFGSAKGDRFGPHYWRSNLERPVLFREAVSEILQCTEIKDQVFLEVGPHSALAGPLRQILTHASSKSPYVATLVRRQNSVEALLRALGTLWTLHVEIDFKGLMPHGSCISDMPGYCWDHQTRHWYESRVSKEWRNPTYPTHDLLGVRVPESTDLEPVWRNLLHINNAPWLVDHRIDESIIYPFAAYVGMAAEAARQVSGISEGVQLRHIIVSNALLVSEDSPTELVTSLRRHRLTDSLNSEWWDFSISSHNGHVWTTHCSGAVRGESSGPSQRTGHKNDELPRRVDMARWDSTLKRHGLHYGPSFNTLKDVTCSTSMPHRAMGSIQNNRWGDESRYHLHPVILDSFFQLQSIAHFHGVARTYRRLIAARVESLTLHRCSSDDLDISVTAVSTDDGVIGYGSCVAGTDIILEASGVRVSFFDEGDVTDEERGLPITARCEWVPHIDFKSISDLLGAPSRQEPSISLLAELTQLAVTSAKLRSKDVESGSPHMAKFQQWLNEQPASPEIEEPTLSEEIQKLVQQLDGTSAGHAARAIMTVLGHIQPLLKGEETGFKVLSSKGDLDDFTAFMREFDDARYLQCLSHSRPNLRILEIGAGLGDRTTGTLQNLTRSDGQILYSRYIWTDKSSGLVNTAAERFKGLANMEFATLDVSQDLAESGFEDKQFDLIIAAGVVHETPSVRESLKNIRKLLAPEGHLLLQEPKPHLPWVKFVLGTLSSWWSHDQDGRAEEPSMSTLRWSEELAASGFDAVEHIACDSETSISTLIVARALRAQSTRAAAKRVSVLCNGYITNDLLPITQELVAGGFEIQFCSLDDVPPQDQDVLALLDEQGPFLDDINPARFTAFKTFLSKLKGSGVLWVTRICGIGCKDPRYGKIVGLARTIRSEMAIDFAVCETEDLASPSVSKALLKVLNKFQERGEDGALGPDYEYAIREGEILNNRIFPCSLDSENLVSDSSQEATLAIAKQGRLSTLQWASMTARDPGDDEVEVEVHATGLNFRDILIAMGIIESRQPAFGYEATGIVRRVGANVTKLHVGDRAVLLGLQTFSTVITAAQTLFEKLPDGLSFTEGASMPLVFATAIRGLVDLGQVSKGQSVLIHSGCGGVGLAAIQIARMLEADIFTTVSSEEKVQYLMDTYSIPRNHIFNSRGLSFVDDLLRETGGRGVDVALNSLSGEQLHATWKCVAKWGTMVEIGKRDLLGGGKLDMTPFLDNRSYHCADLDQMIKERPETIGRLLRDMLRYFGQGHVKPVPLAQVTSASAAQDAFRYMQQGKHIGKIVLQLRDESGRLDLGPIDTSRKTGALLDATASYLIVGGLGGLGRAIAVWMVGRGARHLTFLSRSAGTGPHDQDLVRELESLGCTGQLVRGDVTNKDDVARAVDGTLGPLKGIIQMSMVLRDQMFEGMSIEDWNAVTEPKVRGTWNLHDVTTARGVALDMFILFSSLSGIGGQIGQANYAAANTFLDSFAEYRQGLGLPCTSIDLGAMEGVGYLSQNRDLLRKMQGTGWRIVQESELLDGLEAAIISSYRESQDATSGAHTSFLLGISPSTPLSSPDSNARLRRDVRMAVYHNVGSRDNRGGSGDEGLRSFLRAAKNDRAILSSSEGVRFLALEIGKKLSSLLLRSEDEETNIKMNTADLGLDSLIAVELRTWWKTSLGVDITVLEMLSMGTLEALGKFAAEKLLLVLDG
ncbi:putative polyketide synthase [Fusarium austroafricanum]|uniref:Putative polyketide synthase n=1 Tax=Fusarium austroafricanum TaxID=2364996 RepID=A0A8H4NK54_9HYPO|nr:putative polyketide synthase [Fusarium austroafricanum]